MSDTPLPHDATPAAPKPKAAVIAPGPHTLPWRAQVSLLHQRTILTLRWILRPIFRLPIDDVTEQHLEARLASLLRLGRQNAETMNTLIGVSNQMQARLLFYEAHIPRMRDLKREFDRQQELLREAAAKPTEAAARAAHGIIDPPSNGHRPLIEVVR